MEPEGSLPYSQEPTTDHFQSHINIVHTIPPHALKTYIFI
jgi:hypothetical protein